MKRIRLTEARTSFEPTRLWAKSQGQIPLATAAIFLVIVLATSFWAGLTLGRRTSEAIAVVNGQSITQSMLYKEMYGRVGIDSLEQLINRTLVMQEAETKGVSVSDAELQAGIDELIQEQYGSQDMFNATLQYYGMTRQAFEDEWRVYLTAKKLLLPTITVTDEELRTYFAENRDVFDIKESVQLRQIVTATKEEADSVLSQLRSGGDFSQLAKEKSIDPTKDEGGSMGWVYRGELSPDLEAVAFALNKDEMAGPIQTSEGFSILQVTDKIESREVHFDEVKNDVAARVKDMKVEEKIPTWLQELRDKADVKYR